MNGQIAVCCVSQPGGGGGGGGGLGYVWGWNSSACIVVALNVDARQIVP